MDRRRNDIKVLALMREYAMGVLLLARPVMYSLRLYPCSGDEHVELIARLAPMPLFAGFMIAVMSAFETTML